MYSSRNTVRISLSNRGEKNDHRIEKKKVNNKSVEDCVSSSNLAIRFNVASIEKLGFLGLDILFFKKKILLNHLVVFCAAASLSFFSNGFLITWTGGAFYSWPFIADESCRLYYYLFARHLCVSVYFCALAATLWRPPSSHFSSRSTAATGPLSFSIINGGF